MHDEQENSGNGEDQAALLGNPVHEKKPRTELMEEMEQYQMLCAKKRSRATDFEKRQPSSEPRSNLLTGKGIFYDDFLSYR